jgi:putative endopeptidase
MPPIRRLPILALGMTLLAGAAGRSLALPAGPAPAATTAATAVAAPGPAPVATTSTAHSTGVLFDPANLDPTASACVDFFRYANGGWQAKHPRPADHGSWGRFQELEEGNLQALKSLLGAQGAAAPGSAEQKIGDFYASCMDEAAIERQGLAPLQAELARIDAVADLPALVSEVAHLQSEGVRVLFGAGAFPSFKNSEEMILNFREGGLGLPERDYYLKDDEAAQKIRDEYGRHVARLLELGGAPRERAAEDAARIVALETRLARVTKTRAERRDPHGNDHLLTLSELGVLAPHLSWERYLKDLGVSGVTSANVQSPDFLKAVDRELAERPMAEWRAYLRWHLLNGLAPSLSAAFVEENQRFAGKVLRGTEQNTPRWQRCVQSVDRHLGEALGRAYVDQRFPPEAKRRAQEMVENLMAALADDLTTLPWMGEATRAQAQKKLAAIGRKIGYPDKWTDYSPLAIDRGSFAGNVLAAQRFAFHQNIDRLGKPVDRGLWRMSPPTVNASYQPSFNEILLPAGILQPPFFDPAVDDAFNYGAIGTVIGHEMTHGFDDQGSQFDAQGNLRNWWSPADLASFKGRAECVARHFSGFSVDGVSVTGKAVLGEAIADLGGLKLAYAAYQRSLAGKPRQVVAGFTPEQRLFLGFAAVWASNAAAEFEHLQVATNPHPLPRFRVNGTVSDLPEFARAFGCKAGDPMVRPEGERCQIW